MTRPLIALAAATALLTGLSGVSGTAVAEAGLSSSLSAPGLFLAAAEARTALRRTTTVDSEVVRLGDVFDGAGPEASVTIATAPAPGERLVLEARTLGALARRYGLDWTPASTADRVVVLRASDTVGSADILSALEDAMRGQGLPAGLEIELGGGPGANRHSHQHPGTGGDRRSLRRPAGRAFLLPCGSCAGHPPSAASAAVGAGV